MPDNYYLMIILIVVIISAAIIIGLLWDVKNEIMNIHTTPQNLARQDVSIAFDRSSYVINSTARVTVIDNNATTYPHTRQSIFVEVMSTSDPQGIRLKLQEKTNNSAYFVNHPYKLILTSLKSNQTIAALKVSPGDTITAIYSNTTMSDESIAQILAPTQHPSEIGATITTALPLDHQFPTTQNPILGNTQIQADNGAILSCYNDVDNDGICDEWEDPSDPNYVATGTFGTGITIPAVGPSNTQYHLDCNPSVANDCPGADMPDIYVEVAYMNGQGITQRPDPATLDTVKQVFLNHGIRLHYYIDDNDINQKPNTGIGYYTDTLTVPGNPNDPPGYSSFFAIKKQFFGNVTDLTCSSTGDPRSPACGTDNGAQEIKDWLTAKRQFFHYVLFIHAQQGNVGSSGWGEQFGNDFVVSLGDFSLHGQGSPAEIAGTFMHELGHNLNLGHGGNPLDTQNCKPNYQSVMNYAYQFPYLAFNSNTWQSFLDYSETSSNLDENNLIESNGVGHTVGTNSVVFGITPIGTNGLPGTPILHTGPAAGTSGIDWDGINGITSTTTHSELNNFGIPQCTENNLNILTSQNDWQNLNLQFTTSSNFQSGATIYPSSSADELSRGDLDKMLNEMYGQNYTGIDLNGQFHRIVPLLNSTGPLMGNGTGH